MYLDASAAVKLVVAEAETSALTSYLESRSARVSSRVLSVEIARAVGSRRPDALGEIPAVMGSLDFVELDAAIAELAGRLLPNTLRSLDAIHLASALAFAGTLEAFVTYDHRQADAARAAGLVVASPS